MEIIGICCEDIFGNIMNAKKENERPSDKKLPTAASFTVQVMVSCQEVSRNLSEAKFQINNFKELLLHSYKLVRETSTCLELSRKIPATRTTWQKRRK